MDAIGVSQSWVVKLRKEIAGELERQKKEVAQDTLRRERERGGDVSPCLRKGIWELHQRWQQRFEMNQVKMC